MCCKKLTLVLVPTRDSFQYFEPYFIFFWQPKKFDIENEIKKNNDVCQPRKKIYKKAFSHF